MNTISIQITIQINSDIFKSSILKLPFDEPDDKEKRNKLLHMLADDLNTKIAEKRVILDQCDKLVVFSNYENMVGWVEVV